MADQSPVPPPATPPQAPATPPAPAGPTINIGEEYGTAKKNLPPAKIVLIAIAVVAVVVLIMSFVKRAKPQGSGSLDNVVAVEIPGQNSTMAALTFTLHNGSDKALYVHSLQGKVTTASGEKFDTNELTAAHATLPFGTKLRVTNTHSGRSVTVRVNDRGPYVPGRVVDVSYSAAEALGMVNKGVAPVKLDVVQ